MAYDRERDPMLIASGEVGPYVPHQETPESEARMWKQAFQEERDRATRIEQQLTEARASRESWKQRALTAEARASRTPSGVGSQ